MQVLTFDLPLIYQYTPIDKVFWISKIRIKSYIFLYLFLFFFFKPLKPPYIKLQS